MRNIRLAYLSGPADAFDVHEKWSEGSQIGYFGTSHLSDFFEVCTRLDADGYVITTLPGQYVRRRLGRFLIENRPVRPDLRGIRYHLSYLVWLARALTAVLRFRPTVFVVTAAQNYWFLLSILRFSRILLVPALTCTIWQKFTRPKTSWRVLLYLNKRLFYSRCPAAMMVMSEDIATQARAMIGAREVPIHTCLPTYSTDQFASFAAPSFGKGPFNVFFAGRIEVNKGVYDLVTIAERLERLRSGRFHFHVCGDGSELSNLRELLKKLRLERVVECHGYCERDELSAVLNESHAVIVPTTTAFEEGFNMVCAEAVLAGRPLITSAVCPALAYVREAAIEVPPDDVDGYYDALLALASERKLYQRKRQACASLREQFYDERNGWGAKLTTIINGNTSTAESSIGSSPVFMLSEEQAEPA